MGYVYALVITQKGGQSSGKHRKRRRNGDYICSGLKGIQLKTRDPF